MRNFEQKIFLLVGLLLVDRLWQGSQALSIYYISCREILHIGLSLIKAIFKELKRIKFRASGVLIYQNSIS